MCVYDDKKSPTAFPLTVVTLMPKTQPYSAAVRDL
jgi:hypothetical protein